MKKSELKQMIREEYKKILREKYIDQDDAGYAVNLALDDLKFALKKVKNPEVWAEKYLRSVPDFIETVDRVTTILLRMK